MRQRCQRRCTNQRRDGGVPAALAGSVGMDCHHDHRGHKQHSEWRHRGRCWPHPPQREGGAARMNSSTLVTGGAYRDRRAVGGLVRALSGRSQHVISYSGGSGEVNGHRRQVVTLSGREVVRFSVILANSRNAVQSIQAKPMALRACGSAAHVRHALNCLLSP